MFERVASAQPAGEDLAYEENEMSFDPTTFRFERDDASSLTDEQIEGVCSDSPDAYTRTRAAYELRARALNRTRERCRALDRVQEQRRRDAIAAFDKVYLPLRHKVGPDDDLELSLRGDDVHALLFLCELGLLAAGVDPDRGMNVGG